METNEKKLIEETENEGRTVSEKETTENADKFSRMLAEGEMPPKTTDHEDRFSWIGEGIPELRSEQEINVVYRDMLRLEKSEYDRLMKRSAQLDVLLRILFFEPLGKVCTIFDARELAKAAVGISEYERITADLKERDA